MHRWRPWLTGVLFSAVTLALSGCAGGTPSHSSTPDSQPTILPDTSPRGRVVTVNVPLRYVVMDFDLRPTPALDQVLSVYRGELKVGEVKVTGPIMGSAAAGDILSGQAAVGDTVHED